MSTLIVAAILVGIVTGLCLLFITIDKRAKRKRMHRHLHRFSELGSKYQLTFSSQEILKKCVIGLDGIHRKILVLQERDGTNYDTSVIDLAEVKGCSVKEQYGTIKSGELKARKLESYLELVVLQLELSNGKGAVEIPFYQHLENHVSEGPVLEQKAKHWEAILSKLVPRPVKKTA
jgi:hypothetical protein